MITITKVFFKYRYRGFINNGRSVFKLSTVPHEIKPESFVSVRAMHMLEQNKGVVRLRAAGVLCG